MKQYERFTSSFAMRRLRFAAALLVGFSAQAFAQGTSAPPANWDKIVAAAMQEGRVVIYSAEDASDNLLLKSDFEKAYPGISMEFISNSSGPLLSRMEQERLSGSDGADVPIFSEATWMRARLKDGQISKPIGPSVTNWPAKALIDGTIPIFSVQPIGMAYNTNLVKVPIKDYPDLLRPEFKDKLGTIELVANATIAFYDWLEKKQGPEFLPKLAAQNPRLYTSGAPGAQMAAAGEISVAVFMPLSYASNVIKQGGPIAEVFAPDVVGAQLVTGILGWSKRPNAAQVFVDYLTSRRGQTAWATHGHAISPLPDIPGAIEAKSISILDVSPYTPDVAQAYRAKWDAMFKH